MNAAPAGAQVRRSRRDVHDACLLARHGRPRRRALGQRASMRRTLRWRSPAAPRAQGEGPTEAASRARAGRHGGSSRVFAWSGFVGFRRAGVHPSRSSAQKLSEAERPSAAAVFERAFDSIASITGPRRRNAELIVDSHRVQAFCAVGARMPGLGAATGRAGVARAHGAGAATRLLWDATPAKHPAGGRARVRAPPEKSKRSYGLRGVLNIHNALTAQPYLGLGRTPNTRC